MIVPMFYEKYSTTSLLYIFLSYVPVA